MCVDPADARPGQRLRQPGRGASVRGQLLVAVEQPGAEPYLEDVQVTVTSGGANYGIYLPSGGTVLNATVYAVGAGDAFCGALADALARAVRRLDPRALALLESLLGTAKEGGVAALVTKVVGLFTTGQAELDRARRPVALAAVVVGWVFVRRSFVGYQMQVAGLAEPAARYAGFDRKRMIWIGLLVGGGAAGVAGLAEVAGPTGQLLPVVSPGYGYAAIIVAFVGLYSTTSPKGVGTKAGMISPIPFSIQIPTKSRIQAGKSTLGLFLPGFQISVNVPKTFMLIAVQIQGTRAEEPLSPK